MWIAGLAALQKPLLHLHTQFNRELPWGEIDMDFMNLNQSAHGDREFGYLLTRMGLRRQDRRRALCATRRWSSGSAPGRAPPAAGTRRGGCSVARFGDNMRQVAVTEGDKVEAQIRLGISVNGYGVGDLADAVAGVPAGRRRRAARRHTRSEYELVPELRAGGARRASLRRRGADRGRPARRSSTSGGFGAFTDTFEDLHGLAQLPGIARPAADGRRLRLRRARATGRPPRSSGSSR